MSPSPPDRPEESAGEKALSWIACAATAAFTLAAVGFLLLTIGRGFSYGDEGGLMNMARHPEDVTLSASASGYYAWLFYAAAGGSLTGYRVLSLAALLGSAVVLGLGCDALLRSASLRRGGWPASAAVVCFVVAGQLIYYLWFVRGAGYNSLTALSSNLVLGVLLRLLAFSPAALRGFRFRNGALFGAGAALGLMLFGKPPAFFAAALGAGAVLALAPAFRGTRVSCAAVLLGGVAAEWLLHFLFFQSAAAWYRGLRDSLQLGKLLSPDYDPHAFLKYPGVVASLFAHALWDGKRALCAVLAVLGAAGLLCAGKGLRGRLAGGGLGALLLWGAFSWVRHGGLHFVASDPSDSVVRFCVRWLAFLGGAALLSFLYARWKEEAPRLGRDEAATLLLAAALCFLLPLGNVVGTNRPLTMTLAWYLAPWFALFLLLLSFIGRSVRSAVPLSVFVPLLAGVVCLQLYRVGEAAPFRMATGLMRQDVPVAVGSPPSPLRVDAATGACIVRLQEAARRGGFVPGRDILDFGHTPELVYFLGGRSPTAWLGLSGYPGYREYCRFVLARIAPDRLREAFILQQADAVADTPDLSEFGLRFPEGYVLCGTFLYPPNGQPVSLWRPRPQEGQASAIR